jgi:hypothetical protein
MSDSSHSEEVRLADDAGRHRRPAEGLEEELDGDRDTLGDP